MLRTQTRKPSDFSSLDWPEPYLSGCTQVLALLAIIGPNRVLSCNSEPPRERVEETGRNLRTARTREKCKVLHRPCRLGYGGDSGWGRGRAKAPELRHMLVYAARLSLGLRGHQLFLLSLLVAQVEVNRRRYHQREHHRDQDSADDGDS